MRAIHGTALALGLAVLATGCILTSGQITLDFDLPDANATSSGVEAWTIDLNDDSNYEDHKDELKTLSDLAVLGKFKNNTSTTVDVEVWITTTPSSHTTESALKSDVTALKMWGPFVVGPNATEVVNWNNSAKLFTSAGKQALINEAKSGSPQFTLYAIGAAGTYDFSVTNGSLVLTIDAGI